MKKILLSILFLIAFIVVATVLMIPKPDSKIEAEAPVKSIDEIASGSKILVLNYHQIGGNFTPLCVPTHFFDEQMAYLKDNGYVTITPEELYEGIAGNLVLPERPVMITFDDGYVDNYTNAMPVLKKYGMRATIFVVPGFTDVQPNYLTWEQLKEMEKNGFSVQSHTLNHRALEELPDDEIRAELLNSKLLIEKNLGHPVDFLAYPTGTYNLHIAGIAKDVGYKAAFTIRYGNVDKGSNIYALERVPIFQTENTMKAFFERIEYRQSFETLGWIKK